MGENNRTQFTGSREQREDKAIDIHRTFDFACHHKQQQCEPGCNYLVNGLLKEITSTTN